MTRLRSLLIVLIAIGMPNHVHCILYRLEFADEIKTLQILQDALTEREKKKKQLHKVFKNSFDAKAIFSEKFLIQKLNYIPARQVVQTGITIP